MLKKIDSKNMGSSNLGWLRSKFHFSFAEYYNPKNMNFGVLRVINDDLIEGGTGFDTHPHRDMEIISYVVDGELTHGDSMGNKNTISRGQVQYMSAGTGVYHSEHNLGKDVARFLQIWILPDRKGYEPNYGDYRFNWSDRQNKWLHMVSGKDGNAPIKINQDMNIYTLELEKGREISFPVREGRQAYLVQIEGSSVINGISLADRDAMEIVEEDIITKAEETSHIMILEMNRQD
jgi:redox-sensitive bicupin YhaK (pirin superfamily)